MIFTGISDEAASSLEGQIRAAQELGWDQLELRAVAGPGFAKTNFLDLPEATFQTATKQFETARVGICCVSSTIMNWSRPIEEPFEVTLAEVRRAIPRMKQLGTRFVRLMSFKPGDQEYKIPAEVFRRVREVSNRFLDAGLRPLHENCRNYGGMSWQHALELLDKCPGLQWLFDTANPLFNSDRSKSRPWPQQDPWEFWENLRGHTAHLHIKDAQQDEAANQLKYCWPGEGQGRVRDILQDALERGYDGALSIEPHTVTLLQDAPSSADQDERLRRGFVEYGRRLEKLVDDLRTASSRVAASRPSIQEARPFEHERA